MKKRASLRVALFAALALPALALWQAPLHAEEAALTQHAADPYDDLYAAIDEVTGTDQAFDRLYQAALRELLRQPGNADLEARAPGFLADIGVAMKPWIKLHLEQIERYYQPRFMAQLRTDFSADDAALLAAFYRTGFGRKHLLEMQQVPDPETQPVLQPNPYLVPAGSRTIRIRAAPASPPPPEPAVTAFLADEGLRMREVAFFTNLVPLAEEIGAMQPDKDIRDNLLKAIEQASASYVAQAAAEPLS